MSYSRFGWDGSDVYVYLAAGGYLNCCGCWLSENGAPFVGYYSTADMIAHLAEHRAAGHNVTDDTIDELLADADENDAWMVKP